jgi:cell division protein FtsL
MKSTISQPTQKLSSGMILMIAILWVLVVISALAVVASTQQVRRQIDDLETLRRQASQLQVQWGQYLLERSTWAAYGRVEHVAVSELNMKAPVSDEIVMIRMVNTEMDNVGETSP